MSEPDTRYDIPFSKAALHSHVFGFNGLCFHCHRLRVSEQHTNVAAFTQYFDVRHIAAGSKATIGVDFNGVVCLVFFLFTMATGILFPTLATMAKPDIVYMRHPADFYCLIQCMAFIFNQTHCRTHTASICLL